MKKMKKVLLGVVLIIVGMVIATVGIKSSDKYVEWKGTPQVVNVMHNLDRLHEIDKIIADLKNENAEHIEGIKELEEYRDTLINTIKEYEKLIINRDDAINELHGTINQRDNTINELTKELTDLQAQYDQAYEDVVGINGKLERVLGQ